MTHTYVFIGRRWSFCAMKVTFTQPSITIITNQQIHKNILYGVWYGVAIIHCCVGSAEFCLLKSSACGRDIGGVLLLLASSVDTALPFTEWRVTLKLWP